MKFKKHTGIVFSLLLFAVCVFYGCSDQRTQIALSKGAGSVHYNQYAKWLKSYEEDVDCIDLYFIDRKRALDILDDCSGLVLTGGPDVHPAFYGKGYDTARCSIDRIRDTLEFALIQKAMKLDIPILAICRGEQILNVAMGGSLIVDIPEDFGEEIIHRCEESSNCFHEVFVVEGTNFKKITHVDSGVVNTNHHQAVDEIAPEFRVSAYSKDSLIEAFEWAEPAGKPPLIAVQWHPERLSHDNPLSSMIAEYFLLKVKEYEINKNNITHR